MSEVRGRKSEVENQAALTFDFRPPISDFRLPTSGFRRPGATLLEVLVAIFIMGIGLIALLVLFPLGALTMAQAIQRDRAAHAAVSASAIANVADVRRDSAIYNPTTGVDFFYDPLLPGFPKAGLEKKSYPVLVDPVGYFTAAPLASSDSVFGLLRRRPVSFTPTSGVPVYKWFTFQDDIIFDKAGNAKIAGVGPLIERDVRYSIAYLLQRPRTVDPSVVDCSVIVYDSRPLGLAGNLDLPEFAYYRTIANVPEVAFDPAANLVRIRYGPIFSTTAPPIRSGDWILDVSVVPLVNGDPHGYFYRVAGVTEAVDAVSPYVDLETQLPLRGFANATDTTNGARLLFLEGAAEVFERGLGKQL